VIKTNGLVKNSCIDPGEITDLSETMHICWLCKLYSADYADLWWPNLVCK